MKTQSKLKTPPRPLFSCGIFGNCTQSVVSPTTPHHPPLPPPPPLPSHPQPPPPPSSSSSSSTSQSFTQWRFPLPKPPFLLNPPPESLSNHEAIPEPAPEPDPPPPITSSSMAELFHMADLQLSSGSAESARLSSLQLLEKMLVPNPLPDGEAPVACPPAVMAGVVECLKDSATARTATKVLLALCLAEENRRVAVAAGAVAAVVEGVAGLQGSAAERALAALELLCTVAEGVAGLRAHALTVPVLVNKVGKMGGRGKECSISVLAAIFASGGEAEQPPPPVVAQAVVLALQGECSARGRRKGTQLLRVMEENGRMDVSEDAT